MEASNMLLALCETSAETEPSVSKDIGCASNLDLLEVGLALKLTSRRSCKVLYMQGTLM